MKKILLEKNEKIIIDKGVYNIKSGSVISKQIFQNGKVLLDNCALKENQFVGNFFGLSLDIEVPEFYIEIFAVERTILEEVCLSSSNTLKKGSVYQKIIYHLLSKLAIDIFGKVYDRKEYILFILNLLADEGGSIEKKLISPEMFNLSKSHYYLMFNQLKEERFLDEELNEIRVSKKFATT